MPSLGELIQLAQFQMMNKQMNDPLTALGNFGEKAGQAYGNMKSAKTKNRMMQLMQEGGSGFSYEMDDDGKVKIKYNPNESKKYKSKMFSVGGKIVSVDPDTGEPTVEYDSTTGKTKADIIADKKTETDKAAEEARKKAIAESRKYDRYNVNAWEDVPGLSRIIAAVTPSATPEEQQLGGLRFGGIFKPPKSKPKKEAPLETETSEEQDDADESSETVYFLNKQTKAKEPFRKVKGKWVRVAQ